MLNSKLGRILSFLLLCVVALATSGCGEKVVTVPHLVESKNPPALTSEVTPPVAPTFEGSTNGDLLQYIRGLEESVKACNSKLSKLQ